MDVQVQVFKNGRFVVETSLAAAMPAMLRGMLSAALTQVGALDGGIIEITTKDGELMEIVIGTYLAAPMSDGDDADSAL